MKKPRQAFDDAEKLATTLVDQPYANTLTKNTVDEKKVITTIYLTRSMKEELEDIVIYNKRNNLEPTNFSSLVYSMLEKGLKDLKQK